MDLKEQASIIEDFCKDAKYFMVRFEKKDDEEFGKVLLDKELKDIDLSNNEIYRSIEFKNEDRLFVYDTKPKYSDFEADNPIKMLMNCLDEARLIESVYPGIFKWCFDGLSVKAYAVVPSGDLSSHSTISRYGGTNMFIRILKQHLGNIGNMSRGLTPDYGFLKDEKEGSDTELSLGSINKFSDFYSICINPNDSYLEILKNSKLNKQVKKDLNVFNMKFWTREINPDFISEPKHIKLKQFLTLEEGQQLYPQPIKAIMELKRKGNYNRFLLARFFLSVHSFQDAKFIYYSVLWDDEFEHTKSGDCSGQWNFVANNMKRYNCPTMRELQPFCSPDCKLSHPLENIQAFLEQKEKKNKEE